MHMLHNMAKRLYTQDHDKDNVGNTQLCSLILLKHYRFPALELEGILQHKKSP